jgi:hypothetical protein
MEVNGQFHVTTISPVWTEPPVSIEKEARWVQEPICTRLIQESNPGRPVRSLITWAIVVPYGKIIINNERMEIRLDITVDSLLP